MLLRHSAALLLAAAGTAHGFRASSPFFLLSTEPIKPETLQSSQLSTALSTEERLLGSLEHANAPLYLFVSVPALGSSDFHHMARLRERASSKAYKGKVEITELMGRLEVQRLANRLASSRGLEVETMSSLCEDFPVGANECRLVKLNKQGKPEHDNYPIIVVESAPRDADSTDRSAAIKSKDQAWDFHLSTLVNASIPHVLVLTSGPSSSESSPLHEYDMDEDAPAFQSPMHMDLKRDGHLSRARQSNSSSPTNPQDGLPLFEKYQFLSPGIFMGLTVSLLLFVMLYVAISAIAGLEVSYMAFSKEMGPAAQNKGKQQ